MQDQLVVTGKFLGASKIETVGQSNFTVRRFWIDITTNPDWPNTPEFQLKGDKVNLVDNLQAGQLVQVKFNLDGRKYDNTEKGGKKGVITNNNAWKIDVVQMQSAAVAGSGQPPARPAGPAAYAQTQTPAQMAGAPVRQQQAPVMSGPGQYAQPVAAGFENNGQGSDDLPF